MTSGLIYYLILDLGFKDKFSKLLITTGLDLQFIVKLFTKIHDEIGSIHNKHILFTEPRVANY